MHDFRAILVPSGAMRRPWYYYKVDRSVNYGSIKFREHPSKEKGCQISNRHYPCNGHAPGKF